MPDPAPTPDSSHAEAPSENIKETLISILIAFVLAFAFRSFVIEAFIIPTGSMAPTLMGAHMRFSSEQTGANWSVGPWDYSDPGSWQDPASVQGNHLAGEQPVVVHDPISGEQITQQDVRLRSGDRILVLKYLYALREPARYDVVVFKNPSDPSVNYIKRLLGLPGEQLALVDGDLFTRPVPANATPQDWTSSAASPQAWATWDEPGWTIARKPERVERAVWQMVFDSSMTPLQAGAGQIVAGYKSPWFAPADQWTSNEPGSSAAGGPTDAGTLTTKASAASLTWNNAAVWMTRGPAPQGPVPGGGTRDIDRSITDRYPYNQLPWNTVRSRRQLGEVNYYPVSDLRMHAGVAPTGAATELRAIITARGHQFQAEIKGGKATLSMRPETNPAQGVDPAWTTLAEGTADLPAGRLTEVDFWHVDQACVLFVGGKQVARGEYNWGPSQRLRYATGLTIEQLIARQAAEPRGSVLSDPELYRKPKVRWEVATEAGKPLTMHRIGLERDLHYQPATYGRGPFAGHAGAATHPATTMNLESDQFFVCGDNSPQSQDSRLWDPPEPSAAALMTDRKMSNIVGVVPRDLMMGKAFFVYFPSLTGGSPTAVPDVGRMRFIR